jgi:hypothetical protein
MKWKKDQIEKGGERKRMIYEKMRGMEREKER